MTNKSKIKSDIAILYSQYTFEQLWTNAVIYILLNESPFERSLYWIYVYTGIYFLDNHGVFGSEHRWSSDINYQRKSRILNPEMSRPLMSDFRLIEFDFVWSCNFKLYGSKWLSPNKSIVVIITIRLIKFYDNYFSIEVWLTSIAKPVFTNL